MRILSAGIFLSLLAGKLQRFKQNLQQKKIKRKTGACVFWAPVFFLSLLAGKLKNVEQRSKRQQYWQIVFTTLIRIIYQKKCKLMLQEIW